MKKKLKLSFLLSVTAATLLAEGSFVRSYAAEPGKKTAGMEISIVFSRNKISGGEKTNAKIIVKRNGNTQDLVFRLENSNLVLVRLSTSEIKLKAGESSAGFEIFSNATPIKGSVTIKALLQSADQVQVQKVIEIVPAMLKGVTLSQTTLNGTHGSKITCRVELNANAPMGGIELYLNFIAFSKLRLNIQNPRVEAGNREVIFEIPYDKIYIGDISVGSYSSSIIINSQFNSETRTVELIVSLDSESSKVAIPGIAGKVTFDVIPLRVVSISVQPTSVTGGAEALVTFTLNFPAGHSERVRLEPENGSSSSSSKAWARPLGSSCSAIPLGVQEMPLTQGATTHSFKVCTAPVTTSTTATLNVTTRGGYGIKFPVQITVQQ